MSAKVCAAAFVIDVSLFGLLLCYIFAHRNLHESICIFLNVHRQQFFVPTAGRQIVLEEINRVLVFNIQVVVPGTDLPPLESGNCNRLELVGVSVVMGVVGDTSG